MNSTSSQPSLDATPSDLTLPLKVRFIGDEDRIFKIIWVSPDFKEFHTEYQGNLYTNLADFVNKIFEDFQKPSPDPNVPPPGNLRFDELMYEISPGKWVRLAGNIFPTELMGPGQHNADVSQTYQQPPHILQHTLHPSQHLAYHTTTTDGINHIHNDATHQSFDDYGDGDDDDDDDDDDDTPGTPAHGATPELRRRRSGSFGSKGRSHMYNSNRGRFQCYKCLVYAESDTTPIRVNAFGPTSVRDLLQTIFTESGLKHGNHNTGSEADFLREHSIDIEDQDFGGVKIAFPRSIANFPTKCKVFILRKEPTEAETTELIEKAVQEAQLEGKGPEKELDKEKQSDKAMEDDDVNKDALLV